MKKVKKTLAFLLAAVLAVGSVSVTALAETGTKPEDGTTTGQPFPAGTGGSQSFRIPGIVTLDDGTLVASCDARWNHTGDACGLDTIVSYSTDNGATWNYTFANYLGDGGNQLNYNSTAFIDPAIATDGETVYLIVDLWPGGYAINTAPNAPVAGENGLDSDGNLRLSDDNRSSYAYHLERSDDESTYYVIVENDTDEIVEGYTIDAYFNISGNGTEDSNLFYYDSPYLVYPTDYLYLTTSDDGGATWSVPTLLNLKKEAEQTLLVGPGRGLVTSTGRIIFTAYEYSSGDKNSACFYSDDGGETWVRGESVSSQSSEATVVEADGKLYMFTRHGGYYVSEDWGETWSDKMDPGITYNQGTQINAITYSKKIDGKTAIILSAPSNTSSRAAGKLFVGLVQEDGTISWDYEYSVNGSSYYCYSCPTELLDGSIGLLYENAWVSSKGEILYENIDISDIADGAVIGDIWCEDEAGNVTASVDMASGATVSLTVYDALDGASIEVSSDNEELVTASLEDDVLTITTGSVSEGLLRGTITLTDGTNTLLFTVNVTDSQQYEIVELRMGDTQTYAVTSTAADTSSLDASIASVSVSDGEMTITALTEGQTSFSIDGTDYFIIVENDVEEIALEEGGTTVILGDAILQEADESIVSVEINTDQPPYEQVEGVAEDGQYLIGTSSSIVLSDNSEATNPLGRAMKSVDFNTEDLTDYMWTITAVDDGYTFQTQDGQYLNFETYSSSSCSVVLSDTAQVLYIVAGSSDGYGITDGTYYLNNYGGSGVRAAGYSSNNNNWYFYQTADSYVVTGLAEGRTSLVIGGTTYNITVGNPMTEEVIDALNELDSEVSSVDELLGQSSSYTDESLAALREAYNAAKAMLEDDTIRDADAVQAVLDKLTEAVKNLETKVDDTGTGTDGNSSATGNNTSSGQDANTTQTEAPETSIPTVGDQYSVGNAVYKITSSTATGGTVSYVKPQKTTNKKITVPATVKIDGLTYKVTEISANAFKANKKLTQVTIGANVKKIGKSAFANCTKLKKITIKSSVLKSVGKQALKSVNSKCVIKVPKKKLASYKKLFKGKGLKLTMKIK